MSDLNHRLERVAEFFKPENLDKIALLVIDVQTAFCDPEKGKGTKASDAIAKRIQSLAPEFRKAGIPIYAISYSPKEPDEKDYSFYKFKPSAEDTLVVKNWDSAFLGTNIADLLKGKKLLLACGFNRTFCVRTTAVDARKAGFEVCLLEDMAGNDDYSSKRFRGELASCLMRQEGIIMTTSNAILKKLGARP